jgi:hypothetical protein
MLIYSRVNGAFSPIYALCRTHLRNFKTASQGTEYIGRRNRMAKIGCGELLEYGLSYQALLNNDP